MARRPGTQRTTRLRPRAIPLTSEPARSREQRRALARVVEIVGCVRLRGGDFRGSLRGVGDYSPTIAAANSSGATCFSLALDLPASKLG